MRFYDGSTLLPQLARRFQFTWAMTAVVIHEDSGRRRKL